MSIISALDQIEIVNALQSCRGRCDNVPGIHDGPTILPPSSPDACLCSIDCAEYSSCCPDFAEYCVLGNFLLIMKYNMTHFT